jgi:hypothetical protein
VAKDDPVGPVAAAEAAGEEAAVASPPSATPLPAPSEAAEEGCAAEEGWAAEVPSAAGPALAGGMTVSSRVSIEELGSSSPALATEPVLELPPTADSMADKGASLAGSEESGDLVRLETFGA